ncbi:MAG: vWA domain-containing protein [Acidimicrobiales bacterium]
MSGSADRWGAGRPVTADLATADLATADLASVAGRLSEMLHSAGVPVTPERASRFAAAVMLAEPGTVGELYWAGRVTLLSDQSQIRVFDAIFAHVFGGIADPAGWRGASRPDDATGSGRPAAWDGRFREAIASPVGAGAVGSPAPSSEPRDGEARPVLLAAVSDEERLRQRDFATLSEAELARLLALAGRLAVAAPTRPSRRRASAAKGPELDVRASLRRAARTGGDPVARLRRRRRERRRRLVLICDISGSMEPYARAYLHLLWSGTGPARAEAFVFATRLTRLTRTLRGVNPDTALERAGRAAPDWSGGTRIGEALRSFNDRYGRPGMARGAVVVILSDGWERADPALLGREMERLSRLAHRVVWVNPRAAGESFRPLAGGMAAALPHVNALVIGHSLEALDEVFAAICG